MKTHFALLLVASSLALGTFACGGTDAADDGITDDDAAEELRGVSITEKDDGKTITVTEGQSVIVSLASNPTTGFTWDVTSTDRTFGYPKSRFVADTSGAVGAGGVQKLTWKTKSPLSMVGSHKVVLGYHRPFETNKAPAKTFTFTVKIVAANAAQPVKLTQADDGKTVSATSGQDIVVSLPANATTGYAWKVTSTDRTFGYPTEDYKVATRMVGSGGTDTFTWSTGGPLDMTGSHHVTMEYKRPWETGPAAETFSFTVKISAP